VNTISNNHVQLGVAGGFTQANHGSPHNLIRMQKGDGIVFYSPRQSIDGRMPLQEFTALGIVTDDRPYQVTISEEFRPFRRTIAFESVVSVPIKPLINNLSFRADKQNWGFIFRRGMFEIPKVDFTRIASALRAGVHQKS
jgi:hypothetical protein